MDDSNLLIVTSRYPHGKDPVSSSFVYNQVGSLKRYFNKIYVISLTPFVPKFLSNFSFMHPRWRKDAFAEDYKYNNVEVYFAKHFTLPFEHFRKKRGDVVFKVVDKIIRDNKLRFDIIHAHFTYPAGFVGAKLKEKYKKPLIITIHENRDWFLNEVSSGDKKLIYSWHNANKIIRVNKRDLKELKKIGINESKLLSIPNGFSPDIFKPMNTNVARKRLGLSVGKKILVNIANLEEYKGQKYLIEAMKKVLTKRDDVLLYIVGQGSLKKPLQLMINKCGLQNDVVLAGGNKPSREIPLWMNACGVFVLSSLSEGNPTVMFEALGCGKPFVGTNVGGIPEIIINTKLGILVEPKDVNGLAKAILKALDTKWNKDYILNYAKQFTWDRIAEKILGVYDEVLKKG